jgi:hypothetical protein
MSLRSVPITLRSANAFVAAHHRHHKPARGCIFTAGVEEDGRLCGVATVGRPVARLLQDGRTAEVTRLCTDGTRNACSFLLGLCRRVALSLGYHRLITYTLPDEGGASLRAAGFVQAATTGGGSWDKPSRRRQDKAPTCPKFRWESGQ